MTLDILAKLLKVRVNKIPFRTEFLVEQNLERNNTLSCIIQSSEAVSTNQYTYFQ